MHLGRRRAEPVNADLKRFYERLLAVLRRPEVRDGRWQLRECRPAWGDNATWNQFLAFTWEGEQGQRLLVTVNYGPAQGQCYVHLPAEIRGKKVTLRDLIGPAKYEREGNELAERGLFLDMVQWGHHVFEITAT
jgi:hypothetical protein